LVTETFYCEGKPLFFEDGTAFFHIVANIGKCFGKMLKN